MEDRINIKADIHSKRKRIFIKGLVVPSQWNESGAVTGISLSTFNEEIYFIENNEKEKDLTGFLGKEVEVEGFLVSDGPSKKIIINNFRYFDFS